MVDKPIPEKAPSTQDAINIIHTAHTTANNGSPFPSPPPPPGNPKIPQSASNPIKATATLSPPLGQFFLNTILQIAAFVAAIAFGVSAVKSVEIANAANAYAARGLEEARVANQVAMLAICLSGAIQNGSLASICSLVLGDASVVFPSAVTALFTPVPTSAAPSSTSTLFPIGAPPSSLTAPLSLGAPPSSTPTPLPNPGAPSSAGSGYNYIIVVVPLVLGVSFAVVAVLGFICLKRHRRSRQDPTAVPPIDDLVGSTYTSSGDSARYWSWPQRGWRLYRALFLDSTVSTHQD